MPGDISLVYQTFRNYAVEAGVGDVKTTGAFGFAAQIPAGRAFATPTPYGQTLGYRELSNECRASSARSMRVVVADIRAIPGQIRPEPIEKRLEHFFIATPAADGAAVDRLAHRAELAVLRDALIFHNIYYATLRV
jgi:hypothetical protein